MTTFVQLMQAEVEKERNRINLESRFSHAIPCPSPRLISHAFPCRDFRSIAAEQDQVCCRNDFAPLYILPQVSSADIVRAQILQLFVQHHSSLLHPSKHAPDCIGFKGAFETQRFLFAVCLAAPSVIFRTLLFPHL